MNRQEAQRKRDKAIKMLCELGITDAEIEAELGGPISDIDSDVIIDAEIVSVDELSNGEGVEDGPRHLPAVIPAQSTDSTATSGRDWSNSPVPERRCRAHRKNGEQCKNAAILGSTVCRYHGGASKHVKMAARARLENAADRMAKELLGMAIDPNVGDAVKLSAIKDALDRGDLKAPNEVVLSQGASACEEIFDDIAAGPRAESRAARGYTDQYTETIDAQPNWRDELAGEQPPHHTAPAMPYPQPEDVASRSDCDSPASTQADQHRRRDGQWPRVRVVTGEAAVFVANGVNLQQLPRGRSAG